MKQHVHITEVKSEPKVEQVSRLPGALVGICMAMVLGYLLLQHFA